MNHIDFYQRIAGKYGTSFFHRRHFPLLVHLLYRRGTGEPMFRPPVIMERHLTAVSRVLNRVFHFHHHLHFNLNVFFRENKTYFHSTVPANQVRFFPSFPMVTSHYQRVMYPAASLLPPAGQNPFEKALTEGAVRHLPKLLIMKNFWSSVRIVNDSFRTSTTNLTVDNRRDYVFPRSPVFQNFPAGGSVNMSFQTAGNRSYFVFPRSPVFQNFSAAESTSMTSQTEDNRRNYVFPHFPVFQNFSTVDPMNITYQSVDNRLSFTFPHSTLFREVTDRVLMRETVHKEKILSSRHIFDFTQAPGAAAPNAVEMIKTSAAETVTKTAMETVAAGAAGPVTAAPVTAASAASYTSPAVLTTLTARTPLTSLVHTVIPISVTAAKPKWINHSNHSNYSNQSEQFNLSTLSDQIRGKRQEPPTFEHPRPGTGPVIGARKTAPRSLESMGRYEEAAVTSVKTGTGKIINDTVSTYPSRTQVSGINPQEVDLHRLTDQVYRLLEKRIKTERERRGW